MKNQWTRLTAFVRNPLIPLHNQRAQGTVTTRRSITSGAAPSIVTDAEVALTDTFTGTLRQSSG